MATAGTGGRAQSSQPTIIEELTQRSKLSPTIRSQGIYSYDEARPGYVSRDHMAGSNMGMLARALSDFDRTLIPMLEHRMDRQIEEGVAAGKVLFSENASENKNRMGWKEFTEANPQHTGDNPWLRKGYEEARLQSLGLEAEKTVNDRFLQSGMVNETDPQKVQAWMDSEFKTVRDGLGLTGYADKLMLAKNYTQLEARAKAGMLSQHSQYLKAQQEELTTQQYTNLALQMYEGVVDPQRGGVNPGDPTQEERFIGGLTGAVNYAVTQATANGVRNAKAPEIAANIYLTAYSKSNNPDVLKAMLNHEVNGVKLGNMPGVQEKVEILEKRRLEQSRADLRHTIFMRNEAARQEKENLGGMAYTFVLQNGRPPTTEEIQGLGISHNNAIHFMKEVGEFYDAKNKLDQNTPEVRDSVAGGLLAVDLGALDEETARAFFIKYGAQGEKVFSAFLEKRKNTNEEYTNTMKSLASELFIMFSRNASSDDFTNYQMQMGTGVSKEQLFRQYGEGATAVSAGVAIYKDMYNTEFKKNGKVTADRNAELKIEAKERVIKLQQASLAPQAQIPSTIGKGSGVSQTVVTSTAIVPQTSERPSIVVSPAANDVEKYHIEQEKYIKEKMGSVASDYTIEWAAKNIDPYIGRFKGMSNQSVYNWIHKKRPDKVRDFTEYLLNGRYYTPMNGTGTK